MSVGYGPIGYPQAGRAWLLPVPHERSMIWMYASVCRAFPAFVRTKDLSFDHHQEVAALAREDFAAAEAALDHAVLESLTHKELRDEVRALKRQRALAAPPPPDDRG